MSRPVIYISGPLTADTEPKRQANVARAIEVGLVVYRAGGVPFIPHLNHGVPDLEWADFMAWDIPMVRRCDALIRLAGESKGASVEEACAREFGLPVLYWSDERQRERLSDWVRGLVPAEIHRPRGGF